MVSGCLAKPTQTDVELVSKWIKSEIIRLEEIFNTIERINNYHDEYIQESIRKSELAIRQIRRFIESV
ncbi:MAG TPA: hypothetical protein PLH56_04125 [Candidatus Omnitrophota bacterium]|nr:hypothetical protein [Candidatus Omnitrophota bacterium]HPN88505.1 hypothetical protein [Candidatus Omnitrophota bacterium]